MGSGFVADLQADDPTGTALGSADGATDGNRRCKAAHHGRSCCLCEQHPPRPQEVLCQSILPLVSSVYTNSLGERDIPLSPLFAAQCCGVHLQQVRQQPKKNVST